LLISTYEMGRQPFGLASPAAWLRNAGVDVRCLDLSREPFRAELLEGHLDFVGFHLPMHTATRLALPVIRRVRSLSPESRLCCYGLYAPLNAAMLRRLGVTEIFGGEFEAELVRVVTGDDRSPDHVSDVIPRLDFQVPDRTSLPPPQRYASLQQGAQRRVVGYTEASRGCKHRCRHCPVVPVYNGQFRIVPVEVVLADIRQQVDLGAEHITFGDPDFFNGIGHATAVMDAVARSFPGLTYDATIKIEHLLKHRARLALLRSTGCIFVTSAVESFDDRVLLALEKGHTATDVDDAVDACRKGGVTLVPTFVPFTPWTTLDTYRQFLHSVARLGLVDHLAPIQLALRLLVPRESRLLELFDVGWELEPFDNERLVYPWHHQDARVDQLGVDVATEVGRQLNTPRREVFGQVWEIAHASADETPPVPSWPVSRTEVPYLNEPWYC
jgi:radical SAM superfamily enzyme YgiQ (UPF0313 family)